MDEAPDLQVFLCFQWKRFHKHVFEIDSGFLGDLGNVLRLIKEQKSHGEFGFEYELDFIIVCHYFFFKCLEFVHLL